MLYSRVSSMMGGTSSNAPHPSTVYQDTFDFHDEEDDPVHSNAPSLDNIYESHREDGGDTKCPAGSVRSLPEVKINMDPTERLIEAVESLREAIVENTSIAHRQRSRRKAGAGRVTSGMPSLSRANGMPMLGKDEKLRIRKEKVSVMFFNLDVVFVLLLVIYIGLRTHYSREQSIFETMSGNYAKLEPNLVVIRGSG